jgi:SAM-dependent methyltransferase
MKVLRHPMEWPLAYRLWQAPFAERKLRPVLDVLRQRAPLRVLDIGCGPGTNSHHFTDCEYLGIDINEQYISTARRRFGARFEVADAAALNDVDIGGGWDCVLMNSLLHHLSDEQALRLLSALPRLLSATGSAHILDLVLPAQRRLSRALARLDRGDYPRRLAAWRALFERHLDVEEFTPYPLGFGNLEIWSMVYCRAGRKA